MRAQAYVRKQRENKDLTEEERTKWKDFKLILGNEIYLCRNNLNGDNYDSKKDRFYHFILLAKNKEGNKQLRELSSLSYSHSFVKNKMVRVPTYYRDLKAIIGANKGNVIASSACLGSFLGTSLLKAIEYETLRPQEFAEKIDELKAWIEYIQDIFGKEDFYLELQPSHNQEQIYVNGWLMKFAREMNVKPIISTDSHFLRNEDRPIHKAFLNSKEGEREVDAFYASAYMMDREEIHSYLDESLGAEIVDECLDNTFEIGEKIEDYDLRNPFRLPYMPDIDEQKWIDTHMDKWDIEFPLGANEYWGKFATSQYPPDRVMLLRLINKLNSNKEHFITNERIERMNIELEAVWTSSEKMKLRWSAYLLQVADYVRLMWEKADAIVCPGRGSGVSFELNYLLDIIQVDPIREKAPLKPWRFLNPERASILDIDTDIPSNRRDAVIYALEEKYGKDKVVRVATFKTEKSKSAILTAARGLGIPIETAQYISSMIVADRGMLRSLHDTYYGNEEDGFAPNTQFQEMMNKLPELWQVAQKIEGLITGISQHAGGVIITDEPFTEASATMKLNSGKTVSAFNLEDEEEVSHVKIDVLATINLTRIRACLDLLIRYGYIEKKATLRETYESVLGLYDGLQRDNQHMWDLLADGEILNVFQFDTDQGSKAISFARPNSVEELAALNSCMRLMAAEKGAEQPLDKFARFKKHPELWEEEMIAAGLTKEERDILHPYLDYEYGICGAQEDIMSLIQLPELGGWSLKDADRLRKSIARKDKELYEKLTAEYYEGVKKNGLREPFCRYFWQVLVQTQRGYSFNLSHTLSYSYVALQNMNLAARFPIIFWNTANLIVDSSGLDEGGELEENDTKLDEDESPELIDENIIEELLDGTGDEEEVVDIYELEDQDEYDYEDAPNRENKKKKTKPMKYGRISAAIGKFQSRGISILPPDINVSGFTFTPDAEKNSITCGLRGITRISTDLVKVIIANRPYISFEDFMARVKVNITQVVNLIKSGAFENLCGDRVELMRRYLTDKADTKKNLNLQNMATLLSYDILPPELEDCKVLYQFNKFLKKNKEEDTYRLTEKAQKYFCDTFDLDMLVDESHLSQKEWDKFYKKAMDPVRDWLKSHMSEALERLNSQLIQEQLDKYAEGSISKWEMSANSFYYHPHELAELDTFKYDLSNFNELPEEPEIASTFTSKNGDEIRLFKLHNIAGAVLDKNKMKHTVTILTTTGVVVVKVWNNQFVKYDKQISAVGDDGKKHVIEKSWFSRGTLLLIQGIRRGDIFIPKVYSRSIIKAPLRKITAINGSDCEYIEDRAEVEE